VRKRVEEAPQVEDTRDFDNDDGDEAGENDEDDEAEDGDEEPEMTKPSTNNYKNTSPVEQTNEKTEMVEKQILYEPFIEHIANAFSEAKKAQSMASAKARSTRTADKEKEKEDGWKNVGGNNKQTYSKKGKFVRKTQ